MNGRISENVKLVIGIAPGADALAATKYSDVVSLGKYGKAAFVVSRGVGTTGTQTLTLEACDNFTPSNVVAIPFKYRRLASGDTLGDFTDATAAGFTTAAGGSDKYILEVDSVDLPAGYPNARLKSVEVVDAAVDAGVDILLGAGRFQGKTLPTAIA